jgi:predicted TPR repeat methyltransferase
MSDIDQARALFFEALDFLDASNFQAAEARFRKALRLSPRNPAILTNLSVALLQQGKRTDAGDFAAKAVAADPRNVEALLVLADCHTHAGDLSAALDAYDRIIALEPRIAEAHNNRGLVLHRLVRPAEALESCDRAIALSPNLSDAHVNRGNALHALGRHDEALAAYDYALGLSPYRVEALLGRGNVLCEENRDEEAIMAYDLALALKPSFAKAWLGRGNLLSKTKRHGEALAAYEEALALDPHLAAAELGRGNALRERKRHDEALHAYDAALKLKPDFAEAFLGRGDTLYDLKRYGEALVAFDLAIALKSDLSNAWLGRGDVLRVTDRAPDAIAAYRRALALGGNVELINYYLASLGAAPSPGLSPSRYVVGLFDMYADTFDRDLIGNLNYQSPRLLAQIIARTVPSDARLDILDIGCGTGLMGEGLRAFKRTLTGVDLSPNMLGKARQRGIYDRLIESDIVAFLKTQPDRFDLTVSTDVFIYIGDLAEVFAGVRRALRSDGLFCFSVEAAQEGDFVLRPTLRYAHSIAYLTRLGEQNGFVIVAVEPHAVRREAQTSIAGYNIVMRCSSYDKQWPITVDRPDH